MDAKITNKRLSHLLSYDWLKIIGLILAIIFFWVLVFTVTATREMESQAFKICNYMGNSANKGLTDSLSKAYGNEVFTHEVLEVGAEDLASYDETNAYQVLQARTSVNEFDGIFISQQGNASTAYEETDSEGNKTTLYENTYLESFLQSYRYQLFEIDKYLTDMATYVNGYYENGVIDESKVEEAFRARIARMKDKRYKTEAQIQAGLAGEIERVEKYKAALDTFNGYLLSGVVELVETSYTPAENDAYSVAWQGKYAINLNPESRTEMDKLSNVIGYQTTNDEGETVVSSKNMAICLFDSNGEEECYRYEGLLYVVHLIQTVLAS